MSINTTSKRLLAYLSLPTTSVTVVLPSRATGTERRAKMSSVGDKKIILVIRNVKVKQLPKVAKFFKDLNREAS